MPDSQLISISWCLDHSALKGFHLNEFLSDIRRCTLRRNFLCYHWEGCMWSMQCNMEFGYQLIIWSGTKEITENLDRVGRSHYLLDANWLLASSPALNTRALTLVPICVFFFLFFESIYKLFFTKFYLHLIWISTKPFITTAEGINAYRHKYAYNYTYICNCDSLIIGKVGS
jgi:hypothetical protein